ncbi:type IVB secretion system protein IcmV [Legionella jamestowniensis]|uniref:Intracellular multiplication protein IcmV n=1 Tax=Legionella jamestowniensis TaxID=455 RepID=A0A0W0UYN9_9GAMM|nr:type IVB secretion system protein IcmV [Legionella jamestowniensis]KTD12994.1 intracellular multiplication protein IcmV [Legionella jamestowniensis]OCH98223.1 type IV secretion protein IcmV [Legionella jamestowniensis]SFL79177.1 intracellular multiplication protein IcmV [Legionella jamestowniensis DSM 19215]
MKIKKSTRLVGIIKRIFNVRAWIDFDRVRAFTAYLAAGFQKMFIPQQTEAGESFEAAVARMNLSEQELQAKQIALYRLSLLMCLVAVGIFAYSIYHLYYGSYRAVIVSLVLVLVALVLAFRYHFWYFQIKERKLGCSIREWYREGLKGDKR